MELSQNNHQINIAFFFAVPIIEHMGGVERVTSILTREFQKRGHNVIYVAFMTEQFRKEHREKLLEQNLDVDKYTYLAPQYFINLSQSQEKINRETADLLKRANVNFVIQQDPFPFAFPILKSLPEGIVKIITKHNRPFASYKRERSVYKRMPETGGFAKRLWTNICWMLPIVPRIRNLRLERNIYRSSLASADVLCLLSEYFISRLMKFMPNINLKQVVAISNPNTFVAEPVEIKKKENLVIMVCRMEDAIKNISDFLKAWVDIEKKHPDWHAELVGDGSDLEKLKRMANAMKLNHVRFAGYQKDVSDYFKRAKILCVSSWYEGWGMIIPEGMCFGCVPVCYTTFESIYTLIKDEYNGLLVKTNMPKELSLQLNKLIENPEQLQKYAKNGYKHIEQFSTSTVVDNWEHLYVRIKNEKQPY